MSEMIERPAKDALDHLCSVLVILSDLRPDDRCRAFDEALAFYNEQRPEMRVGPIGCGYTELRHVWPFDEDFDPAHMPPDLDGEHPLTATKAEQPPA